MNKLILVLLLAQAATAAEVTPLESPPATGTGNGNVSQTGTGPGGPPAAIPPPAAQAPASAPNLSGPARGLALVGGRVVTMAGRTYPNGTVLVEKDSIVAVGGSEVDIPSRYQVVDVKGQEVYPGFIETNSQLGLTEVSMEEGSNDLDEGSDIFTPHVRAEDGINVRSELFAVTRLNGITTALVNPGESNLFSGQSAVIDLAGESVSEMVVKSPAFSHLNLGDDPRGRGRSKGTYKTRMGLYAEIRERLVKAQEYKRHLERFKEELALFEEEQKESTNVDEKDQAEKSKDSTSADEKHKDKKADEKKAEDKKDEKPADKAADKPAEKKKKKKLPPEPPSRDLKLEALVPVLKGELKLFVRAHREDDVRNALALAREFGVKIVLSHVSEAWRVAPLLVENGVFASVGPINTNPESWETLGARYDNAALLARAGVTIAIQTGDAHNVRNLPFYAGIAAAHGLGRDEALAAITIDAAKVLGIENRYGSIEKGKVANLLVVDGDPLQPASRVRRLFIRGKELPLKSKQTQLFDKFKTR